MRGDLQVMSLWFVIKELGEEKNERVNSTVLCQNFRFEEKYYRSAMRELLHYLTGSVRLERFIDPRPTFSFWFAMKKNAYVHPPMPSCSPDGFSAIV